MEHQPSNKAEELEDIASNFEAWGASQQKDLVSQYISTKLLGVKSGSNKL